MERTVYFYLVRSQILDVNSMANTSSLGKNSLLSLSSEESKSSFFPAIPKRFIVLILLALATFNMYCTRMCLNVTIVAMTHSEVKIYNSSEPYLSKDMVSSILALPNPNKMLVDSQKQHVQFVMSIFYFYPCRNQSFTGINSFKVRYALFKIELTETSCQYNLHGTS